MGGSFLGGWLAGDLATRKPDRGNEADRLSGELHAERHKADLSHDFSMAAVGAVVRMREEIQYEKSRRYFDRLEFHVHTQVEEMLRKELKEGNKRLLEDYWYQRQILIQLYHATLDDSIIGECFGEECLYNDTIRQVHQLRTKINKDLQQFNITSTDNFLFLRSPYTETYDGPQCYFYFHLWFHHYPNGQICLTVQAASTLKMVATITIEQDTQTPHDEILIRDLLELDDDMENLHDLSIICTLIDENVITSQGIFKKRDYKSQNYDIFKCTISPGIMEIYRTYIDVETAKYRYEKGEAYAITPVRRYES